MIHDTKEKSISGVITYTYTQNINTQNINRRVEYFFFIPSGASSVNRSIKRKFEKRSRNPQKFARRLKDSADYRKRWSQTMKSENDRDE